MVNGTHCILKENTRPLSIFELRSKVRQKYSRKSVKVMLGTLTPIGMHVYISMYIKLIIIIVKEYTS